MEKMTPLNVRMEKGLVEEIDSLVKQDSSFQSRSEYIRTKLRESVQEDKKRLFDETALEIKKLLLQRGTESGLLGENEKKKIADEFLHEKGLK